VPELERILNTNQAKDPTETMGYFDKKNWTKKLFNEFEDVDLIIPGYLIISLLISCFINPNKDLISIILGIIIFIILIIFYFGISLIILLGILEIGIKFDSNLECDHILPFCLYVSFFISPALSRLLKNSFLDNP
jgi:hypothetical protein